MPWSKTTDHDECDGVAVVKDSTGELEGCHETEEEANEQLAALNASEDDRDLDVDVEIAYPDRVQNAAQAALDAKDEYDAIADCGTGVGEDRARAIVNETLVPDDFVGGGEHQTAIPSYLNSHSDDLSAEGPPTDWGEDEWTDGCGNVQYALWGFYQDWADAQEQKIRDQMDRDATLARADASDLSEGDYVEWDSSGGTAYGQVDQIATGETVSGSLEPDDIEHETSEDNPGVIIELVERDDDGEVMGTGDTVFHRPDELRMIDESDIPDDRSAAGARALEGRSYQSRVAQPSIREASDGTVTVKVTTDQIARDGMVLDPEGIRTEDYEKNSVVLWDHGQDPRRGSEPIARCVSLMQKDDGYLAQVEFAGDEFAQRIADKVRDGYINAVSIGWRTEDVEREKRDGDRVPVVRRADMTEFSFVGVPADPDALVTKRMHYKEETSTFMHACKGLMCTEAARRMGDGMTYAQAKADVKSDIRQEVPGGLSAVKGPGCPFQDIMDPASGFEALASVLQVEASALMTAAGVDGCMYDRSATDSQEERASATATSPCSDSAAEATAPAADDEDRDAAQDRTRYVRLSDLKEIREQRKQEKKETIRTELKKILGMA